MFVTNMCSSPDRDMTEEEILTIVKEFEDEDGGDVGQVDINVNDKVVVFSFVHYHSTDSDGVWIILRSDCTPEFIALLQGGVFKGTVDL